MLEWAGGGTAHDPAASSGALSSQPWLWAFGTSEQAPRSLKTNQQTVHFVCELLESAFSFLLANSSSR